MFFPVLVISAPAKRQTKRKTKYVCVCVLSIKYDLQNKALSHHKKYFSETFICHFPFPRFFTHIFRSPWFRRSEKSFSGKIQKDRQKQKQHKNKSLPFSVHVFFFLFFCFVVCRFYKETHSGHHHYQLNDFRCLELLECLTLFVSYKSFTKTCSLCLDRVLMDEGDGQRTQMKSLEIQSKGSNIINWMLENVLQSRSSFSALIHVHSVFMICVFMCIPIYFICFKIILIIKKKKTMTTFSSLKKGKLFN